MPPDSLLIPWKKNKDNNPYYITLPSCHRESGVKSQAASPCKLKLHPYRWEQNHAVAVSWNWQRPKTKEHKILHTDLVNFSKCELLNYFDRNSWQYLDSKPEKDCLFIREKWFYFWRKMTHSFYEFKVHIKIRFHKGI